MAWRSKHQHARRHLVGSLLAVVDCHASFADPNIILFGISYNSKEESCGFIGLSDSLLRSH